MKIEVKEYILFCDWCSEQGPVIREAGSQSSPYPEDWLRIIDTEYFRSQRDLCPKCKAKKEERDADKKRF